MRWIPTKHKRNKIFKVSLNNTHTHTHIRTLEYIIIVNQQLRISFGRSCDEIRLLSYFHLPRASLMYADLLSRGVSLRDVQSCFHRSRFITVRREHSIKKIQYLCGRDLAAFCESARRGLRGRSSRSLPLGKRSGGALIRASIFARCSHSATTASRMTWNLVAVRRREIVIVRTIVNHKDEVAFDCFTHACVSFPSEISLCASLYARARARSNIPPP